MNLSYPVKHWLTSLTVGPLLLIVYSTFFSLSGNTNTIGMAQMYHVFFLVGLFFSLPIFALYVIGFYFLTKARSSPFAIKMILAIVTVVGVVVTFKLIGGSLELPMIVAYSVGVVVSSFFYKIQNP